MGIFLRCSLVALLLLALATWARGSEISVGQIAVGGGHACALLMPGGTIKCWGHNDHGSLGDGTTTTSLTPVDVFGIENATSIALGRHTSYALMPGGKIKAWGYNHAGQLGDGTLNTRTTPVDVVGIVNATKISADSAHACALLNPGGTIKCWGWNGDGRVGDGSYTRRTTPSPVAITNAIDVSAGCGTTCAVLLGGGIKCWGTNSRWDDGSIAGQLGDGTVTVQRNTPVDVVGIATATSVALGYWHACALLNGGAVKCWGANDHGQLGDGTNTSSNVPVDVVDIETATSISVGISNSGCTLPDGSVKTWGNAYLGDGTSDGGNVPVDVPGIINAISLVLGKGENSCVLLPGHDAIKCWGSNGSGRLGDGTEVTRLVPVSVRGPPCDASAAPVNGAVGDCTNSLASGSTCQPTCEKGYAVSGWSSCHTFGFLTAATCSPSPCDASAAPANGGVGDCTNSLASGSTCQPTCDTGYTVSGTSSCSFGVVTTAMCEPNPCTSSTDSSKDGSDGEFYCVNGGSVGGTTGSCTCTSCARRYGGRNCHIGPCEMEKACFDFNVRYGFATPDKCVWMMDVTGCGA